MRIQEMARRVGVSAATLRAWERRYGLFAPERTPGGHRVYGEADLARARRVIALADAGVAVSAAASQVVEQPSGPSPADAEPYVTAFWAAVQDFDDVRARGVLREADPVLGTAPFLDRVLVPVLRRVGKDWRAHPRNVAREHFTSTVVRAHLIHRLADRVDRQGPLVLVAAPAGESHDMGAVMAAVVLADHGWHPVVLGAQTPWASLESLLGELAPGVLLLGAELRPPAARLLASWAPPASCAVVLGGNGFRAADAGRLAAGAFHDGPYEALPPTVGALTRSSPGSGGSSARRRPVRA